MASAGRKFLMAGRGGLNLTHCEPLPAFLTRYGKVAPQLAAAIYEFPPDRLRGWSEALGQPTFTGTSGRVFPKAFKASPLLRAWLRRLDAMGVKLNLRHRWIGWDGEGHLLFDAPDGQRAVDARATVLALGGASWPRLGSDAAWVKTLAAKGVAISPLKSANCGFAVAWSEIFRDRFEGQPLKGAALSFGAQTVRGEAVITRSGIEGGAIYALSADLREAILSAGQATLRIALRPDLTESNLTTRLSAPRGKQSFSNWLRKAAQLSPVGIGLLQEAAIASGVSLSSLSPQEARRIDQRRADQTQRHRADRARDLHRRWNIVRRARRRFHDPPSARRLRVRRNARLGRADRRLPAAGLVCDGSGSGAGGVEAA